MQLRNAALVVYLCAAASCGDDGANPPPPGGGPDAGSTTPTATGIDGVEPLAADEGWTIHVPRFEVPAGAEVTDCYFLGVPDLNAGQDVWVSRVKVGQRPGSHHMNLFRVLDPVGVSPGPGEVVFDEECKLLPEMADWPLVVNSQESDADAPPFEWRLPDGVAHRFRPGELLMLQTHYVNSSAQPSPQGGEVKVNLYLSRDPSPIELGTIFAKHRDIRICRSDPEPTWELHCGFPADQTIHIAAANGHFHSRGKTLRMFLWDGVTSPPPPEDQFYESQQWDDPPMATGLDEVVPAGGGFWYSCEYVWDEPLAGCAVVDERDPLQAGDCCYTFGNTATSSEHCNAFIYYWPKVDPSTVWCE